MFEAQLWGSVDFFRRNLLHRGAAGYRGEVKETASINERIWLAVAAIPAGRVSTYGHVARAAGLPRGARRVGRALAALPPGSAIPWHRVVNAQGSLSLSGDTAREQGRRLRCEGVPVTDCGRIARPGWRVALYTFDN